jgi:hypothetical protein
MHGNAGEFGKGFNYGGPGTLGKQGDLGMKFHVQPFGGVTALESHLNGEGSTNLAQLKMPIFALGIINLWYCDIHVARICRACIIGILGIVGVLYIVYLVFPKVTVIILSPKMHPRVNNQFYINITLFSS